MRSLFALTLVVLFIAAMPRVYADTTPDNGPPATKSMTPAERCHVDLEECIETCSYYEDDAKVAPCNRGCHTQHACGKLEHVNHVARSLED